MPVKKATDIQGRIIRILDNRTVIVNLGKESGITEDSIFYIYGESEKVVDPDTKQVLGEVVLVKAKVKALQVFDKFTIATSKWTEQSNSSSVIVSANLGSILSSRFEGSELRVLPDEVQGWKAISEEPVRVGDVVHVTISTQDSGKKES